MQMLIQPYSYGDLDLGMSFYCPAASLTLSQNLFARELRLLIGTNERANAPASLQHVSPGTGGPHNRLVSCAIEEHLRWS